VPQPINLAAPNATIKIGSPGDRHLARHPDLAVLAIEAVASWSKVESFLLQLFVQLFGGNNTLAAEVFLSLQGQAAKSAAIRAAANSVLKERQQELRVLNAILAISKTNEKARNKLAHWTWGDSPDLPNALLLVDPRVFIQDAIERSAIYVYEAKDFEDIIQANDRLCGYGLLLTVVIQKCPEAKDGQMLAGLSARSEIAEALSRLEKKASSSSQARNPS